MALGHRPLHRSHRHLKQRSPEGSHEPHPQPLTLAIATALITMSSSILTTPIRNSTTSAIVAVGPMYRYIGTR
ncbi:MAG: hypothetical protein ACK559_21635 [bacterium]